MRQYIAVSGVYVTHAWRVNDSKLDSAQRGGRLAKEALVVHRIV